MSDREEREEHIKRLEAALACEEKQFSGKCSKQTCDDNCALLYEQGNWGEWKETLRYAINSLKIDLKYDLLYEETSEQADKLTTKNEAKYCDRNICLKNEYNNVGCEDCEVTKSQEPTTKNDLSSGLEKNSKKLENPTTKNDLGVDCISRSDVD